MGRKIGLLSTLILGAALGIGGASRAATDTTSGFLKSCETDAKSCGDYISSVFILSAFDPAKRDAVCLPKDFVVADVTAAIVSWLASHPEVADEPPSAPIWRAYLELYPNTQACRDTYANSDPFPALTGDFLAYCRAEPSGAEGTCYDEIIRVGILLDLEEPGAVCPPDADPADKDAFRAVLRARFPAIMGWLTAREDLAAQPRRASIASAYKALFPPPCPSR